jgi:hypothetical protein
MNIDKEKPPQGAHPAWVEMQIRRFGPVVGGEDLRGLLGYRTAAAFQKARAQEAIGVALFQLPDRKGWYAFTDEVCVWLVAHREKWKTDTVGAAPGSPSVSDPLVQGGEAMDD